MKYKIESKAVFLSSWAFLRATLIYHFLNLSKSIPFGGGLGSGGKLTGAACRALTSSLNRTWASIFLSMISYTFSKFYWISESTNEFFLLYVSKTYVLSSGTWTDILVPEYLSSKSITLSRVWTKCYYLFWFVRNEHLPRVVLFLVFLTSLIRSRSHYSALYP